jgi:hypothetical protein
MKCAQMKRTVVDNFGKSEATLLSSENTNCALSFLVLAYRQVGRCPTEGGCLTQILSERRDSVHSKVGLVGGEAPPKSSSRVHRDSYGKRCFIKKAPTGAQQILGSGAIPVTHRCVGFEGKRAPATKDQGEGTPSRLRGCEEHRFNH